MVLTDHGKALTPNKTTILTIFKILKSKKSDILHSRREYDRKLNIFPIVSMSAM